MGRGAIIAGCLVTLLAGGCASLRARWARDAASPELAARCQQLSHEAQAAIDRNDWSGACSNLEQLVAQAPRSAEAYQRLSRVLMAQGRLSEAEAAARRALELEPEYVDAMISLGEVETKLGRPAVALRHIDAAIEVDPNRSEAQLAQGQAL
ncbi:MAG TPA: tetratricopeptide repeat protein, partial [Isosphaeraceae bacterium]|nr:tetratricopeptide repeat protein [Isosphaeraceae bacterium]